MSTDNCLIYSFSLEIVKNHNLFYQKINNRIVDEWGITLFPNLLLNVGQNAPDL
jgi:hypothetical protein